MRGNLENEIANYRGELDELHARIAKAKELIGDLPTMMTRAAQVENLIAAAELLITAKNPEWQTEKVKPKRRNSHTSPVPFGELGRSALAILRDAPTPMRTRDIARMVLLDQRHTDPDRLVLDRVTNSLSNYLGSHEGDLVESEEHYPKLWRVIRENENI